MAVRDLYVDNVLRERWDDAARVYTAWDAAGVQLTSRPFTAADDAASSAASSASNGADLLAKARGALAANATFLAIASPTNAQTLAQVKALTRQVNALIRLEAGDLTSVDGT